MVKRSAWCKYEGPSSKNVEMASGIRFFDKLRIKRLSPLIKSKKKKKKVTFRVSRSRAKNGVQHFGVFAQSIFQFSQRIAV